ncbi:MAG: PQQ-binding-like beta-propeller repeat protein [Bacteroidales bacterium]|nr:PQQ-binding-like beta-propeller repeat protein [Bacteroidales bacterium]
MNPKTILNLILVFLFTTNLYAQDQNEIFWKAAKNNDTKTLKELLDKGIDVNVKTPYGATALMFATDKGNLEVVNLLLERGANPNIKDSFYGYSSFLWALIKNNVEIIKSMINHGADISTDEPLIYAVYGELPEVVKLLIEKGAAGVDNALLTAIRNGNSKIVSQILQITKLSDASLSKALVSATASKNESIIASLTQVGAKLPEKQESKGEINKSLIGVYKSKDESRIVTNIKESNLTVSFNGSPEYTLSLQEGNKYTLTDVSGITVSFEIVQNIPISLTVNQGGNTTQFFKVVDQPKTETSVKKEEFVDLTGKVVKPLNWPSFRGNQANGIADGQFPPLNFDATKGTNLMWKTYIPGLAHSCPIIWNDKVFLSTALSSDTTAEYRVGLYGDVEPAKDNSSHIWKMYCIDKKSGKILWEKKAYEGIPRVKRHPKGTQANSTPTTDGEYVVAIFGSEGMVCYDLKGNEKWRKDLGILDAGWFFEEETQWGHASSPIIYGSTVIVQCDRSKESFIAAYDLETGNEVWKTKREEISSWGTPTIYQGATRDELITNSSKFIRGYNPKTGEELWRLSPNSEVTVGTPISHNDLIFVTGGYPPVQPIYAIKPGGSGNISIADSLNSGQFIQWRTKRGGTYMPTPIAYNGYLYTLGNNGALTCYDANTGEKKYKETLKDGQAFTASPVAADGKLYFTSEEKGIIVVKAGPEFEQITINPIGEICMATPAISDGLIFVRGQHHLFCFERK